MASIESRLKQLEQHMSSDKVMPYVFLVGDDLQTAQANCVQSNKQPFPADRPVVLFSIIKPVERTQNDRD